MVIVGMKKYHSFENGKHLIVGNLSKRIDNYKILFTNIKDNNIINLTEPSKITHK